MIWKTFSDGTMFVDCAHEKTLQHASISFRHAQGIWIAFASVTGNGDIWLHHHDKEVLMALLEATLRIGGIIE